MYVTMRFQNLWGASSFNSSDETIIIPTLNQGSFLYFLRKSKILLTLNQCFSYRVNKRLFPLSITVTVKTNRKENFCNKLAARKMSNWMIILEWVFKSVALKNRQTTFLLGYCCLDTVWRHNSRSRKMFFLKIWSCYGHTIYHWKAQ